MDKFLKSTFAAMFFLTLISNISYSQDRLKKMPGYEQYQEMAPKIRNSVKMGQLSVKWNEDSRSFEYDQDGKKYSYNISKKEAAEIGEASERSFRRFGGGPARGRQYSSADSPDGKLKAFTRDRNMWISNADGSDEMAITSDGNDETQLK